MILLSLIYKTLLLILRLPAGQAALTCKMIFFVVVTLNTPVSCGTEREGTGTFLLWYGAALVPFLSISLCST